MPTTITTVIAVRNFLIRSRPCESFCSHERKVDLALG
jgi:hypothetical protein